MGYKLTGAWGAATSTGGAGSSPPRDHRKNMQRALVMLHDGGGSDKSRAGKAVATFMAQTNGRPRPAPRFPLEGGPARKAFVNPTAHWGHNGHSRLGQ